MQYIKISLKFDATQFYQRWLLWKHTHPRGWNMINSYLIRTHANISWQFCSLPGTLFIKRLDAKHFVLTKKNKNSVIFLALHFVWLFYVELRKYKVISSWIFKLLNYWCRLTCPSWSFLTNLSCYILFAFLDNDYILNSKTKEDPSFSYISERVSKIVYDKNRLFSIYIFDTF